MPTRNGAVHVATTKRIYKGKVYQSQLLRRSYRQDGKVKHQTLGNLSHLPPDLIETIRRRLRGEAPEVGTWHIVRSLPHGHVAAIVGTIERLGLERSLASRASHQRTVVLAMIVARLIAPASKLATARGLKVETATTSLALELGLGEVTEDDLYGALDWLAARQRRIETKLAKRHLADGTLVLYDVTSSYYTGHRPGLVQFGYNRDGKRGVAQIVYGLLCNAAGCPVAIEVFAGNTADANTLASQIDKLRKRFAIERVVFVGDRGMLSSKRIDESLREVDGLEWITALRADSLKKLASQGVIALSLFAEQDLVEVASADYPGERLLVCQNPLLAEERSRKRQDLLAATQKELDRIVAATQRVKRRLHGKDTIALRVGKVLNHYKMGKHFELDIDDERFAYRRNEAQIAEEAALDGLYVIRTSVAHETLSAQSTVRAYKDLAKVERAFRTMKTVDLHVRPIYHWLDDRIKAHVFLCMLAYYVEWHMRQLLAPILFDDHDKEGADAARRSVVAPAVRSRAARRKARSKRTEAGEAVHSFRTLLADLGTLCKNRVRLSSDASTEFSLLTQATATQQRALELLGVVLRT
jgi:hypothetical protein